MVKGVFSLCYILMGEMQLCDNNERFTFSVCSFIGAHFFCFRRETNEKRCRYVQKMYSKLFNTITDVVKICDDEKCVNILAEAQKETENIYITYYE